MEKTLIVIRLSIRAGALSIRKLRRDGWQKTRKSALQYVEKISGSFDRKRRFLQKNCVTMQIR